MKPKTSGNIALAFALTLAFGTPANIKAQSTAGPAPGTGASSTDESNIVTLDPFVVNTDKDAGYTATDSLAGGRQSAPIRVTPAAISSITGQFIQDLHLTDMQEVLKWSLNTVPTAYRSGFNGGIAGNVFNFWSTSTRGDAHVQGGNPPTKNYFPVFVLQDTYNVDRVEFDHGPNSILFGIGDIGGATSTYTKRARFDSNFAEANLSVDNYGGYRGTIDVNTHRGDLALRLNAVAANEKGFRDDDFHHKLGATLAGDWRLNQGRTHLRFEVEGWKEKKAIYGALFQDDASLWDGTTSAATWGATIPNLGANPQTTEGAPGVTGMSDWGLSPNYNVIVAGSDYGVMNWAGGVKSMGTNNIAWGAYLRPETFNYSVTGGTSIMALPSREFSVGPKDGYVQPENLNATLTFDQQISDNMDLEISAYHYVDDAYSINYEGGSTVAYDLNQQLPTGAPNPNYGKLYSDFFLDKQVQNHWVNEIRGQLSYHFDTQLGNVPLKQVLSASAGRQVTEYDARQYNARDTSVDPSMSNWTSANWTRDMVWGRIYWDNPHAALDVPSTVDYTPMPFNWYDFDSKQTITYAGAFSQSRLWDDRLNITLGARRDKYKVSKVGLRGPTNIPVENSDAGNTYSAGAVGYVTDWLGLFVNFSDNYQPAAGGLAPSLFGDIRGASFGKGQNYGFRFHSNDEKYSASITYYKDTATDVIGGDHPDFQGIWNAYLQGGGTATDIGPAGTISGPTAQMQYNTIYDVKYTGWEFEATANPTKNIRLQIHYARPKGERTNDGVDGKAYYDAHKDEWLAVAGNDTTGGTNLQNLLDQADANYLIWANPTLAGAVPKEQWNAFATYSFYEDALKGLSIGFGATHSGGRQVNQTSRTTPFTTESLLLGYSRKFNMMDRDIEANFQINVDNLFGTDTLVFTNYNGTVGMDYNMVAPRKTTFTVSFQF